MFRLVETLEYLLLLCGVYSATGITELHDDITANNVDSDFYTSLVLGELESIGEYVHHDFPYLVIVKVHLYTRLLAYNPVTDFSFTGSTFEGLELVFYKAHDVSMNVVHGFPTGIQFPEIK